MYDMSSPSSYYSPLGIMAREGFMDDSSSDTDETYSTELGEPAPVNINKEASNNSMFLLGLSVLMVLNIAVVAALVVHRLSRRSKAEY